MDKLAETTTGGRRAMFSCDLIENPCWSLGQPLHVEGCMIMLCQHGRATFSINSRTTVMRRGSIAFFAFDMVIVPVSMSDDFCARTFSIGFDATQDLFFLVTSNRFWDFIYKSPIYNAPYDIVEIVERWFSVVNWISTNSTDSIKEKSLRNEAENFVMIMAEQIEKRLGMLGLSPPKNRAWSLINDFIALLNRHYATHHDVAYYAERLHISPNYLNIIVKKHIGISAKEQINLQIGLVARMLLDTTDLSVKQIADRLHYDDPSYLCRIFRKQTGMSPMQYRNKLRTNSRDNR